MISRSLVAQSPGSIIHLPPSWSRRLRISNVLCQAVRGPPARHSDACYRAARAALPDTRLGGGMFSFFTELNRKRPPVALLDFVTFTTVAIFHAGDDRSAMEGLESLPYLAKSVAAFIDGKPYHVGPSAIGLRMNPYGEAPMANPRNIRQAMNGMDPRQRGLFAAAWSVGFVARFAKGGRFCTDAGRYDRGVRNRVCQGGLPATLVR